jgi:hypothetical protein
VRGDLHPHGARAALAVNVRLVEERVLQPRAGGAPRQWARPKSPR